MTTSGFWTGGQGERRRASQQHLLALRKRLDECKPEEREQINRDIEDTEKALHDGDDDRILW
jgi:hypothetical protein